jgi:nitroimidazol reductase NimA-like FMN-containing flavoprotein (pyridoxamine 5'-phosphate oxidase superfamily)
MIEIEEMNASEAREVLAQLNFAHLAVAEDNVPYVVPVNYAFDGHDLFVYTTEGKKADIIKVNPEICLQAEEVKDNENWRSVMVSGTAERIIDEGSRQKALDLEDKSATDPCDQHPMDGRLGSREHRGHLQDHPALDRRPTDSKSTWTRRCAIR